MGIESIKLKGYMNSQIFVRTWVPEGEIIGGIHILHGLGEHSGRYDTFANYLRGEGFVVWCHDHRQHGYSVNHHRLGVFGVEDTWKAFTEDVAVVQKAFRKAYENLEIFMLGHSMGSLIARSYLHEYTTDITGTIIMGSPVQSSVLAHVGRLFGKGLNRIAPTKENKLLHSLSIGLYSRSVKNAKTPSDWISHDEEKVQQYEKDPMSGYVYNAAFYGVLAEGFLEANNLEKMTQFPKIPFMLISGQEDPCGLMGKGVRALSETYNEIGIANELVLFDGMRHEVLNEIHREKVYQKLLRWLKEHINEEK